MNAAIGDPRTSPPSLHANRVTAKGIAGVNADPDEIARLDPGEVDRIERFVDDNRIAEFGGRRRRDDVEPSRGDDRGAEGQVARIDEMDAH